MSTQRQLPPAPAANDSCSVGGPSSDDTIASRLTPLVDRMLLRPAVVQMPAAAGGAGLTINSIFICLLFLQNIVLHEGRPWSGRDILLLHSSKQLRRLLVLWTLVGLFELTRHRPWAINMTLNFASGTSEVRGQSFMSCVKTADTNHYLCVFRKHIFTLIFACIKLTQ